MLGEYYLLGRSGLRVSRLALGAMTFGEAWGWGAKEESSRALFNAYVEAGGNFIDTADMYVDGQSEELLGTFVKEGGLRDRLVISTKFTFSGEHGNPNAGGNGRKNILRAVDRSLQRLKTDYIDLYILHTWDRITPAEEVMRTLDDLVRAGKIRHAGLSDIPAWYASRAQSIAEHRGYEPISAMQLEYSLAERSVEWEFVDFAVTAGAGIMVWSPLCGGLLSGKYRQDDTSAEARGRLDVTRGSANPAFKRFNERNFRIVRELEAVANEIGRTMAQVAVNWVANRPGVASVILGATKPEQLAETLAALDFSIPSDLATRLDMVSAPERPFPYWCFGDHLQAMITGGTTVGDKPRSYQAPVVSGPGAESAK